MATEMASSSGPNTMPSDLIMNQMSSPPLSFSAGGAASWAWATLENIIRATTASAAKHRNRPAALYRVDERSMRASPERSMFAGGGPPRDALT